VQHGRPIFNLSASFHVHEEGLDHQRPMPEGVPDPEGLPPFDWGRGVDLRYVPPEGKGIPRQRLWMRADGKLPDDPLLHVCIVAYASDMSLLDSIMLAHDITWDDPRIMVASLDHAMWFHRPFRADEWLLYDQESHSSSGGRGLGEGHIYRRDGTLVVSVVQEGLVRLVDQHRT